MKQVVESTDLPLAKERHLHFGVRMSGSIERGVADECTI